MPRRTFQTQQLIDWGVHELDECEHVLHHEDLGMDKFECDRELVFRAPDDGRCWRFVYQYNNGAGYNDITGCSTWTGDCKPRPEREEFTAVEVAPLEKVVVVYAPVPDPQPVTTRVLHDLLGLIMAKSGNSGGPFDIDLSDVPSDEVLDGLTPEQREEVAEWAATCHAEASDNDVRAGPCPACLRTQLPGDHPYKTWRVG